jgi:hypothetical protein
MGGSIASTASRARARRSRCSCARPTPRRGPTHPPATAGAGRNGPHGQLLYIEDNPINVMLVEELVASRSGLAIVSELNGDAACARREACGPT